MTDHLWYWVVVAALCLLLEFVVPGAILSFIGIAAGAVALGIYLGWIGDWVLALNTFLLSSIFLILVVRTVFLRFFPGDSKIDNVAEDAEATGALVEVIQSISPEQAGRIRYRQSTWEAVSLDFIPKGEKAAIVSRTGQCWTVQLPKKGTSPS